jgi:hypothetical protein
MSFTDSYELTEKAIKALKRIKDNRLNNNEKDKLFNESRIPLLTTNKKLMSEEYDNLSFDNKIEFDKVTFEKLLTNLTEEHTNIAKGIISDIQENIKEIYQLSNIKPRTYGFTNFTTDMSKESLLEESDRIIKDHFNKSYYNLTTREREKKYKDKVVSIAHDIISENEDVNTQNALDFSYKAVLLKDLIKKISFPYLAETKINELLESDLYKEFFDSERLHILRNDFDSKVNDLAKIISISL